MQTVNALSSTEISYSALFIILAEANGAYLLNPKFNPARGIVMAESPCWCEADYFEVICNCMPGPHQHMTDPQEVTSSTDTGAATSARTANTTKEAQPIKAPTKQVMGTSTVGAGAVEHIIAKAVTDAGGIPTTHYNYTESGHNNDSGQMIGKTILLLSVKTR